MTDIAPAATQPAPGTGDDQVAAATALLSEVRSRLSTLFVGQDALVEGVLTAVVAGGHVLVESLPGLGKTLLVKSVARLLGLAANRIQFTPDLMPSDITGSHVFDLAERKFIFHQGPVFTQFLLADEFNRSPAKTHAALLEVMAERQVTADGRRYALPPPFIVMATANPIENEGTYALPEAQLDRFLLKLVMGYPSQSDEERILNLHLGGASPERTLAEQLQPATDAAGVLALQQAAAGLVVDPSIVTYIATVVRRTRGYPGLHLGASPRAGLAMLSSARALALMRGRAWVIPDDVVDVALPALRHRVILSPEAEVEGRTADAILGELVKSIEVPRGARVAR
jgi:MoxR-like ATPase